MLAILAKKEERCKGMDVFKNSHQIWGNFESGIFCVSPKCKVSMFFCWNLGVICIHINQGQKMSKTWIVYGLSRFYIILLDLASSSIVNNINAKYILFYSIQGVTNQFISQCNIIPLRYALYFYNKSHLGLTRRQMTTISQNNHILNK